MSQGFGGMAAHVEGLRRQLTPARWKGLQALAQTGQARVSNITTTLPPSVYWQVARWMVANGIARPYTVDGGEGLAITLTGRQLREVADR